MKVSYELNLASFEAWSGAVSTLDRIREEGKVSDCEYLLEELYPDGIDETHLNDILWFDSDWLYEQLGISDDES